MGTIEVEGALAFLGERLALSAKEVIRIVVCGGSALIVSRLVSRQTTKDVDVVAMINDEGLIVSPDPLPENLIIEARKVERDFILPANWLNNEPSRGDGGLFQLGLPDGFKDRLTKKDYGKMLSVYFVGRLDQICFKVYAAVDQGVGRHVDDLRDLLPIAEEIEFASRWAMTHDSSVGFRQMLISMLEQLGYGKSASKL